MTAHGQPARPQVSAARRLLKATGIVAAAIAIWYALAFLLQLTGDPLAGSKLPYPHVILERFVQSGATLADAAWATGSRAVMGFFVGLIVGTLFGVLMIQARWIESAFLPYVLASQMVPLIALVPILRAVLREPDLVRLYVTAFVTFFIVTIAVLRGLKNANPTALELMDSLDASRWKVLRYLRFPAALPYIFSGLRIAAPLSLIGAILVDFLGARNGLGYLMVASLAIGPSQASLLWAALLVSLGLGLLFTAIVAWTERRVSFWQPAYRSGS